MIENHEIFSPVIVSEILRFLERFYRKKILTPNPLRLVVEMREETRMYFRVIVFVLTQFEICQKKL